VGSVGLWDRWACGIGGLVGWWVGGKTRLEAGAEGLVTLERINPDTPIRAAMAYARPVLRLLGLFFSLSPLQLGLCSLPGDAYGPKGYTLW
jgi:hypothetical protein